MPALSVGYHATRHRISELVGALDAAALATPVPACPAWSVHDVVAHLSGVPESLAAGDVPGHDRQGWLDRVVAQRQDVAASELLERWEACAEATSALVDGAASMLFADVVTHEHDLRGALGRQGGRGTAEVRAAVPLLLDALAPAVRAAGLRALVVDCGPARWATHFSRPGCTLRIDPWEAVRVLQCRRTAEEVRSLPSTGDVGPYLEVLRARSPLPARSLEEHG